MSDTIYDWARRQLDAITLNGRPLDIDHTSALAVVLSTNLDVLIQELPRVHRWDGSVEPIVENNRSDGDNDG